MKDRDQKSKALKYAISKGWFPQLEVDVHPLKALGKRVALLTDLDVLASAPDDFEGFRLIVFDCKTTADQSAINRALWLRGVLDRMRAAQGVCILRKNAIELDHKLVATKLGIILLAEDEFDLYATTTSKRYGNELGHVSNIDLWDKLFGLKNKYISLASAVDFSRSTYWMIDDAAEACRKTLATIHEIRAELDPAKDEHMALVFDLGSLFSRALAILCSYIFNTYLHPKQQGDLEGAVRVLLYGGREAYEHRNQLYRMLKQCKGSEVADSDLTLPEWARFIQLVRQVLDAPIEVARTPSILREVGFKYLASSNDSTYAKELCAQSPQAGRFAVLSINYLFKAAKLPPEFLEKGESMLLQLLEK
jgi:hypothetical protein